MKITIKGTNIELSDSIREYIFKKIDGLEKFTQRIGKEAPKGNPPIECWVEMEVLQRPGKSGNIFRAEAQIKLPGASGIRAESTQWDIHQAIDEVKDELQQQLKRYKEKMISQRRKYAKD